MWFVGISNLGLFPLGYGSHRHADEVCSFSATNVKYTKVYYLVNYSYARPDVRSWHEAGSFVRERGLRTVCEAWDVSGICGMEEPARPISSPGVPTEKFLRLSPGWIYVVSSICSPLHPDLSASLPKGRHRCPFFESSSCSSAPS